jgi:hypothetical protein
VFESITETQSKTPRWVTLAACTAAIGVPFVVVIALLANAARPGVILIVAGIVLWLPAFGAAFYTAGQISERWRRYLARAAILIAFLTPSIIVGEGGLAPAPAIVVLFVPGHFWVGAGPLIVVGSIVFAAFAAKSRKYD